MKKLLFSVLMILTLGIGTVSCGTVGSSGAAGTNSQSTEVLTEERDLKISEQLEYDHEMERIYANQFAVDYYKNDYKLLTIHGNERYLMVPEHGEVPEDLDSDIVVIQKPVKNIYLVASAVMDMFVAVDGLDTVRFSALEQDSWYIDEAKEAMEQGSLIYAGKYNTPDYELIVSEGCSVAIENTMITHSPEIREQLEKFQIPVFVDYSSYESDPMGRTEWVKLYGALIDREAEAEAVFAQKNAAYEEILKQDKTESTVAFFYITSNGMVNVRKTTDYLPKMIELAGGHYVFEQMTGKEGENNASSTVSLSMEEFYATAKDADYIIYNSSIDGELQSLEDLIRLTPLLKDFRAVQNGNVYCTAKNLYQSSMELSEITTDIYKMLHQETEGMTYLFRLN